MFAGQYTAKAIYLVSDGNVVMAEVRGSVQTRAGERYDNEYCFVFRFRGDRIAEIVEYCDADLIERVLGSYDDACAAAAGAQGPQPGVQRPCSAKGLSNDPADAAEPPSSHFDAGSEGISGSQ